ncbi:hypothetical protein D3C84_797080 [compost metagenome]
MLGQFGPGQLFALAVFTDRNHGDGIVTTAQQVFGKVQGGAGKPLGAGHVIAFDQYGVRLRMEADVEEIDDGLPEIDPLIDGPLVQGGVVGNVEVVALIDGAPEGIHAGLGDAFGVRLPEDVGHFLPLLFLFRDPIAGKPAPTGYRCFHERRTTCRSWLASDER